MSCHVARYKDLKSNEVGWALVENGLFAINGSFEDTSSFLSSGSEVARYMRKNLMDFKSNKLNESHIELLSPITRPCKIICQGANYPSARKDLKQDPQSKIYNTLFHKSDASITGPYSQILKPAHVSLLDYEVELALVIGDYISAPTSISEANISKYVAGVVMVNDITARDIQIPQLQFYKGKSYRTFCPSGPYLCLLDEDELCYLDKLNLSLSVNGELKQQDKSENMIYKPYETLSELSHLENLAPGDIVLTGSPGGCALSVPPSIIVKLLGLLPEQLKWKAFVFKQRKRSQYLRPGDAIRASIKSGCGTVDLGTQENIVA